jgi:hypothetical protein
MDGLNRGGVAMKTTTKLLIAVAALASGLGAAAAQGDEVVLKDGRKTYTVEVISADPSAKTLTIRDDSGPSTLYVEDEAMGTLRTVRPGDTITIATRDDYTGSRRMVNAIVSGTANSWRTERRAEPAEFVGLDPDTRRVTVIGEDGERQVFRVDDQAILSLSDARPGRKLLVSYRYDRQGRPEAVVRVASAAAAPVLRVDGGSTVEVVSANPSTNTLTIRTDEGRRRTLVVDDRAAIALKHLKAGDSVILGLEDDRVMVISRKY